MTGYAFAVPSTAIFSAISHRIFLKGVSLPAKILYNLTKNLTAAGTTIIVRCSLKKRREPGASPAERTES
ncbi:MAG: hypothetical protein NC084_05535 [Bacteroides sp.]|nr:hypothetical protein [Eubacterium sp.]MCM1418018.1 hypothetical protein [Roseburia sp.]MCM1462159.1 hypothetical protein [Bacteroides sp.]